MGLAFFAPSGIVYICSVSTTEIVGLFLVCAPATQRLGGLFCPVLLCVAKEFVMLKSESALVNESAAVNETSVSAPNPIQVVIPAVVNPKALPAPELPSAEDFQEANKSKMKGTEAVDVPLDAKGEPVLPPELQPLESLPADKVTAMKKLEQVWDEMEALESSSLTMARKLGTWWPEAWKRWGKKMTVKVRDSEGKVLKTKKGEDRVRKVKMDEWLETHLKRSKVSAYKYKAIADNWKHVGDCDSISDAMDIIRALAGSSRQNEKPKTFSFSIRFDSKDFNEIFKQKLKFVVENNNQGWHDATEVIYYAVLHLAETFSHKETAA